MTFHGVKVASMPSPAKAITAVRIRSEGRMIGMEKATANANPGAAYTRYRSRKMGMLKLTANMPTSGTKAQIRAIRSPKLRNRSRKEAMTMTTRKPTANTGALLHRQIML